MSDYFLGRIVATRIPQESKHMRISVAPGATKTRVAVVRPNKLHLFEQHEQGAQRLAVIDNARQAGPVDLHAPSVAKNDRNARSFSRQRSSAAKINFDKPRLRRPIPTPVIIQCRDRQSVCGAVVGTRLVPALISGYQPQNLRFGPSSASFRSPHPYSAPDSSLLRNQGDGRLSITHNSEALETFAG
jgi:hypothetical protein